MTDSQVVVVSDSTPLIYLAKIGRLNLLRGVFEKIYVPEAVFNEAVTQGKELNMSDAFIIEKAVGIWIIKELVDPKVDAEFRFLDTNTKLGSGEKEALKLCKQLNAVYFIADDREARSVSRILNIKPIGTCGILIQTFRQASITEGDALQILDDLVKVGFRISSAVYRRILDELGISP
jgi:predicted nucleic acid-binding protein